MAQSTIFPQRAYLTAAEMRRMLIERIAEFRARTGMSRTRLGVEALNDGHAIPDIEAGRNLSLDTYQRLMNYLDDHASNDPAKNLEKEER